METASLAVIKKWCEFSGAWRWLQISVIVSFQDWSIKQRSNWAKLWWDIGAMGDDPIPQYVTNESSGWSNQVFETQRLRDSQVSIKSERFFETLREASSSPKQLGPRYYARSPNDNAIEHSNLRISSLGHWQIKNYKHLGAIKRTAVSSTKRGHYVVHTRR